MHNIFKVPLKNQNYLTFFIPENLLSPVKNTKLDFPLGPVFLVFAWSRFKTSAIFLTTFRFVQRFLAETSENLSKFVWDFFFVQMKFLNRY